MSPALNGSSVLQRFECGNAVETRNRMMFDFYPGLPHMYVCVCYKQKFFQLTTQCRSASVTSSCVLVFIIKVVAVWFLFGCLDTKKFFKFEAFSICQLVICTVVHFVLFTVFDFL